VQQATGWQRQATLTSWSDETPWGLLGDDQFGRSVAIAGDKLAVVRMASDLRGPVVYRRERGTWRMDTAFAPDRAAMGQPISVALDADRLLLGDNANQGAYVYLDEKTGKWMSEDWLTAESNYNLGYAVALAGRVAVLGGLGRDREDFGHVYAFVRSQGRWSLPMALLPDDGPPASGFGTPVAASGSTVVVGASFATEDGIEVGAAYVFDLDLGGVP
jgi:hypothetical protein